MPLGTSKEIGDLLVVCESRGGGYDVRFLPQGASCMCSFMLKPMGLRSTINQRIPRSIFPAGTVSGAPKVRAMELIAELEREKRGVYAGAVGYFGYNTISADGSIEEGGMDT